MLISKVLRNLCEKFLQYRGIVYPKWSKIEVDNSLKHPPNIDDEESNIKIKTKWQITAYAYSFSKNIEKPSLIRKKKENKLNHHVQHCKFKRVYDLKEKFKIYP